MWGTEIRPARMFSVMPDTFCRACGAELFEMAVCVRCSKAILYGCPRCATFTDTQLHIGCLHQLPMVQNA